SVQPDPEKTAMASAREVPIKPKHAVNVCRHIRGMKLGQAKRFLEAVTREEAAVPFFRHIRTINHRRGKIGPGLFPVKAAGVILQVVESAESNAEYKGLDPDKMFISHAACQRAPTQLGQMPRAQGRATPWNTHMSHIEIVLSEREERAEAPAPRPRAAGSAKGGAKKKPAKAKSETKEGGA
ncbi:MAG: 50S ribosomal protein L22, partial [Halobacteriales archaeon]|nr:50S ribosomal protein L22 [Halobacteriales archaeon]